MSRWVDIAKKNSEESFNTTDVLPNDEIKEVVVPEVDYVTLDIQEELETKILDTYSRLIEVVNEGLNGFILCDESHDKSNGFLKMVYKNLDYTYYGKNDNNENHDAESDMSEEYPWENKRNRFAYT